MYLIINNSRLNTGQNHYTYISICISIQISSVRGTICRERERKEGWTRRNGWEFTPTRRMANPRRPRRSWASNGFESPAPLGPCNQRPMQAAQELWNEMRLTPSHTSAETSRSQPKSISFLSPRIGNIVPFLHSPTHPHQSLIICISIGQGYLRYMHLLLHGSLCGQFGWASSSPSFVCGSVRGLDLQLVRRKELD